MSRRHRQYDEIRGSIFRVGIWGVALAFEAHATGEFRYVGLFKRERSTRFARFETWFFTPF